MLNRRRWLNLGACAAALAARPRQGVAVQQARGSESKPLELSDYEPRSMLHTSETNVPRARYPVIDIHTHLSFSSKAEHGVSVGAKRKYLATPESVLPTMEKRNLRALTNLTGGFGDGLREAIDKFDKRYPGRFYTFAEPSYDRFLEKNYPQVQAEAIEQAHAEGAKGLKILKTLGLYLRESVTSGELVKVDDPRFDPMWETCGKLGVPVAIHVSDPVAFFTPTDRFNERYEELSHHPDWSFFGRDYPSNAEILEARNRVFARHSKTKFITLHVGNYAENLDNVSENLDRFPNMFVDIAARIGELGRQPRRSRRFFEKYQDRILFGTDATPNAQEVPQQIYNDKLYETYFRFLETEDEYFDYAPVPVPPQGRWRIYGVGLPDDILHKVYLTNAARLLNVPA
jgi:predicted TIM-barrel fold metal-dependent hydrolase